MSCLHLITCFVGTRKLFLTSDNDSLVAPNKIIRRKLVIGLHISISVIGRSLSYKSPDMSLKSNEFSPRFFLRIRDFGGPSII